MRKKTKKRLGIFFLAFILGLVEDLIIINAYSTITSNSVIGATIFAVFFTLLSEMIFEK